MSDEHPPHNGVPHEVELKYAVPDLAGVQAFLDGSWTTALPDVVLGEASVRLVEDRYFDTTRGALRRHGFGARLRRHGSTFTLTVKSLAADEDASAPSDARPSQRMPSAGGSSWKGPRTPDWSRMDGRPARRGSWWTSCAVGLDCVPCSPSASGAACETSGRTMAAHSYRWMRSKSSSAGR